MKSHASATWNNHSKANSPLPPPPPKTEKLSTTNNDGWTTIIVKKQGFVKSTKNPANGSSSASPAVITTAATISSNTVNTKSDISSKKQSLQNNSFFLPPSKEKMLHDNDAISTIVEMKNTKWLEKSNLKCHKRNQQRKKRRAALRALKMSNSSNTSLSTSKDTSSPCSAINPMVSSIEVTKRTEVDHQFEENSSNTTEPSLLMHVPDDIMTFKIMVFLSPKDVATMGMCSKQMKSISESGYLWSSFFKSDFESSAIKPVSDTQWKLAYKLSSSQVLNRLRCFHSKKTFLEDVLGVGLGFTVNPKTKCVDYVKLSQDLLSATSFEKDNIRSDAFGSEFKAYLPLYFSEEHFQRSLPLIKQTIRKLCPEKKSTSFHPSMVIDVIPKIVNTFVVLVSDEGLAASEKSFHGLIRIHQLFLGLAHKYPSIKHMALQKLLNFTKAEENRSKHACPNLGHLLPLLMIVDEQVFNWSCLRSTFLSESFDRSVLWVCKAHPSLEKVANETSLSAIESRIKLTREAMTVSLRLKMLQVHFFSSFLCRGTTKDRAALYDAHCGYLQYDNTEEAKSTDMNNSDVLSDELGNDLSKLSFRNFKQEVNRILSVNTWQQFFRMVKAPCPKSKDLMAKLLRDAVKNSLRKGYHKKGMNFAKIHASGTSTILSKGQQYSTAGTGLKRVTFHNAWGFEGSHTVFLDASCLIYSGKNRVSTVDYRNRSYQREAVSHSGDVMEENGWGGVHTITLNLKELPAHITSLVFVLSAWAEATLHDITRASIRCSDADKDPSGVAPLCSYDLDAHDKISHLKSIVMCKLYRREEGSSDWHVLAIGDSYGGSAANYGPIYDAVSKHCL